MKRKLMKALCMAVLSVVFVSSGVAEAGDKYGAVDISVIAKNSVLSGAYRVSSGIKKTLAYTSDTWETEQSMASLMAATMASDWMAVRTVIYGLRGVDKVSSASSEYIEDYVKTVVIAHAAAVVANFVGNDPEKEPLGAKLKEIVEGWNPTIRTDGSGNWDGNFDADGIISQIQPLYNEIYKGQDLSSYTPLLRGLDSARYTEMSAAAADMAAIKSDLNKMTNVFAMAERIKGIPGLDSESGSLWERMLYVGYGLLIVTCIASLVLMIYDFAKGDTKKKFWMPFMKYAVVFIILAFVPNIVLTGISIADSIKEFILGIEAGGNATERYELLFNALEIRSEYYKDEAGIIMSKLPSLTNIVVYVSIILAQAVIWILLIMGDVMLAISILAAPLVFALSLIPSFEDYLKKWTKGIITFLFYPIAAAIYTQLMLAIVMSSYETDPLTLIIISVCYLMGAVQIPNIAESMNGAVLASVGASVAMMPGKALGTAVGGIGGGAIGMAGAGISKVAGGKKTPTT